MANTDPMRRLKIAVKCINAINLVKEERKNKSKNKSVKESYEEIDIIQESVNQAMEKLRETIES